MISPLFQIFILRKSFTDLLWYDHIGINWIFSIYHFGIIIIKNIRLTTAFKGDYTMKSNGIATSKKTAVIQIALCAVFTALTCVFTMFIQIPVLPAMGGIVHFGNVPLFIAAAFFGKKTGAIAGGVGMALSDLLTPWAIWAPVSLIVVGIMGFVFGLIADRRPTLPRLLLASFAVLLIKIAGYYIGEVILYGNLIAPLASVPGNITQIAAGAVISVPIIMALRSAVPGLIGNSRPAHGASR